MANRKDYFVAIDIGGSKIEAILWRAGKIIAMQKIRTPKSKKQFLAAVFQTIQKLSAIHPPKAIGISLAGAIDAKSGVMVHCPNLPFLRGVNLQKLVEQRFTVKTRLANDAKCFLLGEIFFGSAKGKKNVIGIIIGTGFGGALYLDGRLIYGKHGFAGEQGAMKLLVKDSNSALSVEQLVSSHGFRRLGVAEPLDYQNRARAGDPKAIAVYNQIGKFLGLHLANLTGVFDPELIVIGGGIARADKLLLKPAVAEMKKYVILPRAFWPAIRTSKLKNAGLLGAIALVSIANDNVDN